MSLRTWTAVLGVVGIAIATVARAQPAVTPVTPTPTPIPGATGDDEESPPDATPPPRTRPPVDADTLAPREVAPGAHRTDRTRARRMPGSWSDPLRSLTNMPGVAPSFLGLTGELVFRGASPEDTRILIQGHDLPLLLHFVGLKSQLHPALIETLDVVPGGFGARHGRATGGLVDVGLRTDVPGHVQWDLHADLLDAGVLTRVPVGGGVVSVAARRSYADLALDPVGLDYPLPYYFDYQLSGDFGIGDTGSVSVLVFGADDGLRNIGVEKGLEGVDPALLQSSFHRLQARWEQTLADRHRVSISGMLGIERGLAAGTASTDPVQRGALRADYATPLARWLTVRAGADLDLRAQSTDQVLLVAESATPLDPGELAGIDPPERITNLGGYLETTVAPARHVQIVPGIRFDRLGALDTTVVDPRLAAVVQARPGTTVRASAGLYHQPPRIGILGAFVTDLDALGLDVEPEESVQLALGLQQDLGPLVQGEASVWWRRLDHVIETYPLELLDTEALQPVDGEGRAVGAEISLRLRPLPAWFGWATYAWSKAERRERGSARWFPSAYDQTHQLTLVLSYRVLDTVRLGTRVRFATGAPFTPYVGSVYDADTRRYYGIHGERNSARTGSFFQADLRIDKLFRGDRWGFVLYADVMNVTNHANHNIPDPNFDYTRLSYVPSLPVFPMIGLEAIR